MNKLIVCAIVMLVAGCQQTKNTHSIGSGDCNGRVEKKIPYTPVKAAAMKIDGRVVVSYIVGNDGHPQDIRVVSAQPKDVFERETLRAVRAWCLNPTTTPQTSTITFRINATPELLTQ